MNNFQILNGLRLLVVDDDIDTLELIKVIFEEYNTQVVTATLTNQAFQLITQFQPDILISDIALPDEDGYTFIRKVRINKNQQVRQTPAIALTALPEEESLTLARNAGFTAHVTKPFDIDNLIATVGNLALMRKYFTLSGCLSS